MVTDLSRILESVPLPQRPVCGPFAPGRAGCPPPGRVEYLGSGIVRLDEAAVNFLAGLAPDDDFHIRRTAAGPVLSVDADSYLARQEEPDDKALRPPTGRVNGGLGPGLAPGRCGQPVPAGAGR